MSLLQRGTDTVTVYPETAVTDTDGNTITRPGSVGVICRAVVQPITAARTAENTDSGGFTSETRYRLRLVNYPDTLGAQSQVEWNGRRYSVDGDPLIYNGSPRTARAEYVIVRR